MSFEIFATIYTPFARVVSIVTLDARPILFNLVRRTARAAEGNMGWSKRKKVRVNAEFDSVLERLFNKKVYFIQVFSQAF